MLSLHTAKNHSHDKKKYTENNIKYKQIIKYKHINHKINENIKIKIQKCIDKTKQQCYYKTIKKNKRKNKTKKLKNQKFIQFIA